MASTQHSLMSFSTQPYQFSSSMINKAHKIKMISKTGVCMRCERRESNFDIDDGGDDIDMKGGLLMKKKKLRILIAGGGIAGLVFALAAKRSGFDVKVLERELSAVRGEGKQRGPIQLLSSGLGMLEAIDKNVARQILQAGSVTGAMDNGLADGHSGEWFVKFDMLTPAVDKGLPVTRLICRMEFQKILLNAIGNDIVYNKSKVVDYASDSDKVTVFLENGQQYEADLLIGADGIRSTVRSRLFGSHQQLKYSNFTCYSGFADCDIGHIGYKAFLGLKQYFVALNIGRGKMQWYAFVRETLKSHDSSVTDTKAKLAKLFGNWCSDVVTLICTTREKEIMQRPIFDVDMVSSWGRDRVILLGDAAHAMLPTLGQGGSLAIEDCYSLMLELQNVAKGHLESDIPMDEITSLIKRFEKRRMFRVSTIHAVSRLASEMTSYYRPYFRIGSLPIFVKMRRNAIPSKLKNKSSKNRQPNRKSGQNKTNTEETKHKDEMRVVCRHSSSELEQRHLIWLTFVGRLDIQRLKEKIVPKMILRIQY